MEIELPSNKIVKIKNIKCPTCKKQPIKMYAPFCSKKCSDSDLIKWLSDEYQIINNDDNL